MKTLLGTTVLAMALAAPSWAQTQTTDMELRVGPDGASLRIETPYREGVAGGVRASDFIGKRLYMTPEDARAFPRDAIAAANADWEDVGEVSDLIVSLQGDTEAVLVDFGGFLGIGEKTVAVSMSDVVMIPDADSPDDYFLVFQGVRSDLEMAPVFQENWVFEARDEVMAEQPSALVEGSLVSPMDEVGSQTMPLPMWDAALVGQRVTDIEGQDVGEIVAVAGDGAGRLSSAVVDVGGFIGLGEKRVALGPNEIEQVINPSGEVVFRLRIDRAQLEAMPEVTD